MKNFPFGLEKRFHGKFELLSCRLHEGPDEDHQKPYSDSWCPD